MSKKKGPLSSAVDHIPSEWQDRILTAATVYATVQYGPLAGDAVRFALISLFGG